MLHRQGADQLHRFQFWERRLGGEPCEVTKGLDCEIWDEREGGEACLRIAWVHLWEATDLFLYIYILHEGRCSADIDFVPGSCCLPLCYGFDY